MDDFTGEVGLKPVTRVLAYPGIGHKILLRSKSSHIFLVPLTFLMISKGPRMRTSLEENGKSIYLYLSRIFNGVLFFSH